MTEQFQKPFAASRRRNFGFALISMLSIFCAVANPIASVAQVPADDSQVIVPADGKVTVPKLVTPYDSSPTVITAPPPAVPVPHTRPKVGLALGGGGTRGAAHIGALRVLMQENIPVDVVVGTSMGAVVGGLYCAGLSADEMQTRFEKGLMRSFMTVSIPVRMAIIPILAIPRLFGYKPYDGFYRGAAFRKFLQKSLPDDKQAIENLNKPFGAVALNLLNGQAYCITKGNVGEAMQASAALPVLRRPVKIDKGLFVDGGVVANLPCTETRALGAQFVIAVDVDERFEPMPDKEFRRLGSVAHRVLTLHLAKVDDNQRKEADIVIHPNVNGIGLISTKKKDIDDAITAGEEAARLALPEIREKLGLESKSAAAENTNRAR